MRIHFIGICGYAVSGLAVVAKQLGNDVTGSDEDAYPPTTDIVTKAGIKWVDGHAAANLTRLLDHLQLPLPADRIQQIVSEQSLWFLQSST